MNDSKPHAPLIGVVLDDRYRLVRVLGAGGIGMVYEAEDLDRGYLVAVKVVSRVDSPESFERLAREASLVSMIQHRNICRVLDVGQLPRGGPYVVLERLSGETLDRRIVAPDPVPVAEAIDMFLQILSGLDAAHAMQILHRDLKPSNIFLTPSREGGPHVRILDFGHARDLTASWQKRLTRPGQAAGTPQYMSPEQIRGGPLGASSDLFSVGVLLYEVLTARHPFAAPTAVDFQANILKGQFRPLRQRRDDVPDELDQVVQWALQKAPRDRPATARELARALGAVLAELSGGLAESDTVRTSGSAGAWDPSGEPPSSQSA